jgi:hypothetical protein
MAKEASMMGGTGQYISGYTIKEKMIRTVVLVAILVESPNEVLTGLEGAFGILKGGRKLCGDNLIDGNVLRVPTTIVKITVQPTHRAVRARVLGDGL